MAQILNCTLEIKNDVCLLDRSFRQAPSKLLKYLKKHALI